MKLKVKLLVIRIFVICVLATLLSVAGINAVKNTMYDDAEDTLQLAIIGYAGEVSYLKKAGHSVDIVVYEGDTVKESSMTALKGSKADAEVIQSVLKGNKPLFKRSVVINGGKYCVYYLPTDGGMIMAAESNVYISDKLKDFVTLFTGISTMVTVICGVALWLITSLIASRVKRASEVIKALAEGDLTKEIKTYPGAKEAMMQ